MPTPRSPWSQAMLDLLDAGRYARRWYSRDEVLAAGMAAVPPGRAIQQREARAAEVRDGTGPRRPVTDTERIRIGSRSLATRALHDLARRGHIELVGQLVRRTP